MLEKIKDIFNPQIKDKRIFFFHIAKCGGTSIANSIVKCYKPWRAENAGTVVLLNENSARFAENNSIGGYRYVRRDLLNYMMSQSNVKCISGHFQYSNIAHDIFQDRWHFVATLRNPVARWLSHFRYDSTLGKITVPLEEFIETKRARSFGRAFVDEVTEDVDKSSIDISALSQMAIARYKRFSLIGTIEDTRTFAKRFEEIFGCKLNIKHLNKTKVNSYGNDISEHVLDKIHSLCEPDLKLYDEIINKG